MIHNVFNTLQEFNNNTINNSNNKINKYYSLPKLGNILDIQISCLPISIRIILESLLRNYDNKKIFKKHIKYLANWQPNAKRCKEVPFVVSRVILQDFTGVPLLTDITAMRSAAYRIGKNPKLIEPLVPVDLVIDHSVQIDYYRCDNALNLNMQLEFSRNKERYKFMKWGTQAYKMFRVIPPGIGIIHQVNLEFLARGIYKKQVNKDNYIYYPDSLVGTDSHTTMINSIGTLGWGVGGIEAEASMLGQPIYLLVPDVIGIELTESLPEGITATDLVLTITEMLRNEKVVGKFVEFFGEGVTNLTVPDRATISNMAPEYGATIGFFPIDEKTVEYLKTTGRTTDEINIFECYFKAQEMFGVPLIGQIHYTKTLHLNLSSIKACIAGPKRPQDRINLNNVKHSFKQLLVKPLSEDGFAQNFSQLNKQYKVKDNLTISNGDILIAAITSCTNTSNPSVLISAGLLAKKAVKKGLRVSSHIKTSLAPGSRVVTDYLRATNLLYYLSKLGFMVSAYGCTTCIGNSGDLTPELNKTILHNNIIAVSILSGNRNFEARIHPNIKANFLASPPLVVAYAIAGNILKDLTKEPIGIGNNGCPIFLVDIWPSNQEINNLLKFALNTDLFCSNYASLTHPNDLWNSIQNTTICKETYDWPNSTYITEPPFFKNFKIDNFSILPISNIYGARALGIFGNSITTDHISPAGAIEHSSPAGKYLKQQGIHELDFNSYGSRRGNYEIMVRGTFANVRIQNLIISPKIDGTRVEGGLTIHKPSEELLSIYDAAMRYINEGIPTIIFGGEEYGTGSSRDWAAKGTSLLGIKAIIAKSFERIHRSNLVGMGILPLQFQENDSVQSLNISGNEIFDIEGLEHHLEPQKEIYLIIRRSNNIRNIIPVTLRIDTPIEIDYYKHGGIMQYVLRSILS